MKLLIDGAAISLNELRKVWEAPCEVGLGAKARALVKIAHAHVDAVVASGEQTYGVNTGFGQLAQVRISDDELVELQENLVRSHAAGVGELLPDEVVRLIMVIKVMALARGFSGVRLELIDAICDLVNAGIYPCIPAKGSVGASGDLAPLAHMSCALLGIGEARVGGKIVPSENALAAARLKPLVLAPKEGLALLNGTQVSTALAVEGLFAAENQLAAATVIGSLTVEAAKGSRAPFDARIHEARGHQTQIE